MKKVLFTLAILCSLCIHAQSPEWQLPTATTAGQWLAGNESAAPAPLTAKAPAAKLNLKKAPAAVTEPQGELYTYALTNKRVNQWGMTGNSGRADSVYVDGTTVYFHNLVDNDCDGSYAVGQLTAGDMNEGTITFKNGLEYAHGKYAYVGTVNAAGNLVPNHDAATFTFTIKNGVITSVAPAETLGHFYLMGYTAAGGISGYNIDYKYEPVPNDLYNVTIPSFVKLKAYEGICEPIGSYAGSKFITRIGMMGNEVYFKNIIPGLGEAVIKGKVKGAQIEVSVSKYIGKYQDFYISLFAGQIAANADGTFSLTPVNTDKIYLDYDKASNTIKCNDVLVFLAGQSTLGGYWNKPEMKLYDVEPVAIPEDAEPTRYMMTSRNLADDEADRTSREAWVMRAGNDFYFKNFYTPKGDLAFKGTLGADGKTIAVELPQYMGAGDNDDAIELTTGTHVNQATIPPTASYEYDGKPTTLLFAYDPASKKISYEGATSLCTVVYGMNEPITGADHPRWTLQNDTVAIIPETAETAHYILNTKRLRDYSRTSDMYIPSYVTTVSTQGDKVYLHGLNEDFTNVANDAVLVGQRVGDEITFRMPQLISNKGSHMVYAYAANYSNIRREISVSQDTTLVFHIKGDTLSCDRSIAVQTASGTMQFYYVNPSYVPYTPAPAKPRAGMPEHHYEQVQAQMPMYLYFAQFYYEDVNQQFLSPDSLTYSVYLDGELYTLPNSTYFEEFSDDVTEVPMTLVSGKFNHYLMERRIWLPKQAQSTFGVQVHYYCNGVKTSSDIVTIDVNTGVLDTTFVAEPVHTPANPVPERWRDRGAGNYNFMIDLPETDCGGQAIPADKLYYRIYFDDEVYLFDHNNYTELEADATEIAFNLDSYNFSKAGTERMLSFREAPKTKVGVQTVYRSGESVAYSQIGYLDLATGETSYTDGLGTGIAAAKSASQVVATAYYLPSGQRIATPTKGIYIVRQHLANGQTRSTKQVIR